MGGCRCSYKNCERATKNSEKDFHFFHYPVKDPERCNKWIANAKKPKFQGLPEDQLRNKVICQLHFELQYFSNESRKRLIHTAVPTLDAGCEDAKPEEMMNVQVLQSDSEGNVFTVGTETLMQAEIEGVKSYVIQNGNLVPADFLPDAEGIKPTVYRICVADEVCAENNMEIVSNGDFISSNLKLDSCAEPNGEVSNKGETLQEVSDNNPKCDASVTPVHVKETPKVNEKKFSLPADTDVIRIDEQKPRLVVQNNSDKNSSAMEVVDISETIKQHSREIAFLKRIINTKIRKAKSRKRLTNLQIINSLRSLIPSTLLGAVSLHLYKKDRNFTKDEKNFLATMYQASPATYEILLKDFRWKLPSLEVAKKLVLNRSCVR